MVHTNKTNATTAPTTASPTSVTDTDSVVAIPRDGQQVLCDRTMTTAPKALAITAQLLLSKGAGDDAKTLLELIPTLDDTELAEVA